MSSERQKELIECTFNYVEHPAMKAYFDAKEHESYYLSLDTNQRRDFHERLIPILTNSIEEASHLEAQSILDNTIFKAASSSVPMGASLDIIKAAERENSRGYSMLKIAPPLTFDTLKQYYREAAKRYHPDVGGTTEKMQIINAAYQQFHDLLCMTHKGVSGEGDQDSPFESISARSTLDYLYVIGKLLVSVDPKLCLWLTSRQTK